MSKIIARWTGHWGVCLLFGAIATLMFTVLVPGGVAAITQDRTLAPRILDEYYPTWQAEDARTLFAALGAAGRRAYQLFYLKLDFWFPVMSLSVFYAALLSLAFPQGRRGDWLNLAPILMYLSDLAENLNHYVMAGRYPDVPSWQLVVGPGLSLSKYALITLLPIVALAGFVIKRRASTQGRHS